MSKLAVIKLRLITKQANKPVKEIFNYIIEDDFNPDMIHLGLYDSYEAGLKKGIAIGVGASGILAAAGYLASKIIKKKEEKNEL